ncbi:MAG: NAD-dependent epimerase/dehydratase family protein [Daejeonella sp.]
MGRRVTMKVGITGQDGFVGNHLFQSLGLFQDEFERVHFDKSYFDHAKKLEGFLKKCDVIVHLAAINRHSNSDVIYDANVEMITKMVAALERIKTTPHIIFSSSIQEEGDSAYGKAKKKGRELFIDWAERSNGKFSGMIIPNVFGPFGKPFYNSFIATFCYQLTHNAECRIDSDGTVRLIYVSELVELLIEEIRQATSNHLKKVMHTSEQPVSEVLKLLQGYKKLYFDEGIIPELRDRFQVNLFNTFRSYIDHKVYFPVKYTKHTDLRGSFVEIIRLNVGGQVSFSTTVPGITRGNHFHTRKIERFSVIRGEAIIQLRRVGSNEVTDFYLDGTEPSYVDMPIWYTHNIKNIGGEELITMFWINEFYDVNDPDTYMETV